MSSPLVHASSSDPTLGFKAERKGSRKRPFLRLCWAMREVLPCSLSSWVPACAGMTGIYALASAFFEAPENQKRGQRLGEADAFAAGRRAVPFAGWDVGDDLPGVTLRVFGDQTAFLRI